MTAPDEPRAPDQSLLLEKGQGKLGLTERTLIRIVRSSFEPGFFDQAMRFLQRTMGQAWIYYGSKNLTHLHGLERSGILDRHGSVVVVANHRSFFDLYVVTANVMRRGLKKRIIFPVRSDFFYTSWLGLLVNFCMSFLAMYPPLFRKREQSSLNLVALEELGALLGRGDMFVGLHPEGTRNRGDDPYSFLPPKPGVGRVIFEAKVPVVPVFIHGLGNNFFKQFLANFSKNGRKIHVVFGAPLQVDDLLAEPPSLRLFQTISERCMAGIAELGLEEKEIRRSSADALGPEPLD
jgi:1-acyl-sn-glycerol-3-phosphate acyltransferase